MKHIKLNKGKFALVDNEDYDWLNEYHWFLDQRGRAIRNTSRKLGKQKQLYMHREIMKTPDGMVTDHVNHNVLDNRKSNLRICTNQQNGFNRLIGSNSSSGFKGVSPQGEKWMGMLKINGKQIYLGLFKTKQEAAKAYDTAAKQYFGEYARLNCA